MSEIAEPIRTFSGAHPYRPQCVIAAAETVYKGWLYDEGHNPETLPMLALTQKVALSTAWGITQAIDAGLCPRCSGPLLPDNPGEKWKPAGTRVLECRCVPVCETCATWIEPIIGELCVTAWPVDQMERDDEYDTQKDFESAFVADLQAKCEIGYLDAGLVGPVIVDSDGATPIQPRPNPGGWLEHGYDDTADRQERAR